MQQPRTDPNAPAADENAPKPRTEADLRGALNNDSLTEDERQQILHEQEVAEEAAKLRAEDYQLAYAIDILKGLSAIAPKP